MKFAIVGAGGIGATLGAKLALAGHQVALLARGANLTVLSTEGLRLVDHVDSLTGRLRLPASDKPADPGPQDAVIIALKSHQIPSVLPSLAPLLAPHTTIVPAINGLPWWYFERHGGPLEGLRLRALDPQGALAGVLLGHRVLGCVVHIAAELRAPGEVHHTSGRRLILGEPSGSSSDRLHDVCAALREARFEAVESAEIRRDVWTKLIGNLSFNPVAALTGYLMNQICADEGVLEVIRATMREAMAVAEKVGVRIAMTPDERIDIARQLGAAKISMLQDLEQCRTMELDGIVASVIELAGHVGVDMPATRMILALVQGRARALGIAT
jgi:2-dehydropantoate 2-reductase